MALRKINTNTIVAKALIIAGCVLALVAAFFAMRFSFANAFALYARQKEVAELAVGMSPNDSLTHYAAASLYEKSFLPDDIPMAISEYEKAVSLSPYDYRLWLALAKVRERNGDAKGAEKALRKSIELAPNYSELHWVLGNQLLRQGNAEEAFLEIRKAVEGDGKYANPAVVTAWQVYNGDPKVISNKVGESIPIKAQLSAFLAKQNRFDEAFEYWNTLPEKERALSYSQQGKQLQESLLGAKRFRDAAVIQGQLAEKEEDKIKSGEVVNSGFEDEIGTARGVFDWKIAEGVQPQIGFDTAQKKEGKRSLVIIYNSVKGNEYRAVEQTILVESGKAYNLQIGYRSDIKSSGSVKWEILDANDGKILGTSTPVSGISDWNNLSADFTTTQSTQAVTIRLSGVTCKQALCPITGKIWFDGFILK